MWARAEGRLRFCLGTRAPLAGKDVRGTGVAWGAGSEARTGFRREILRTEWGRLGLARPFSALGELRPLPLLTLLSRLSQVLQRIQRKAPTKEARRWQPGDGGRKRIGS